MKTYSLLLTFILTIGFHRNLQGQSLPTEGSDLFYGSGNCATCHLPGSPNTSALLDANGHDVSMVTYWRGTMMANAAKDPLWQAKVKAEVDTHPGLQSVIEDKCTTCHAPMGRTEAYYDGALTYTFAEMLADPLAMDGVSCTVCHQIQATEPLDVDSFSGHFTITDIRQIFGPYTNPVTNPMITNSNYTPVYAPHISQSELCATCHTLFTPYVDDNAAIIGEAPEQTPYLEWLNSAFPDEGTECQTCHVPRITTPIIISNRPSSLSSRTPFGKHEFVGGNQYMLKILKLYRTELGITANDTELDSVIARTQRQLNSHSISLSLESSWNDADELVSVVTVENLTGHKFPTAYPSRRAWLVFTVKDPQGNTVFSSGDWDASFEITGLDSSYELHYDVISTEDQVQVYQAVPKDYLGNKTYTLLRIAGYLKDNRIPPRGYTTTGIAADSTTIEGLAAIDPNFNRDGATEGTGIDLVTYLIPGLNPSITYTVEVKMVYQSLAPRYITDLLTHSGIAEVDTFAAYYAQVPNEPFTLDSTMVTVTALELGPSAPLPQSALLVHSYPNPFNAVTRISFYLPEYSDVVIAIYDLQGRMVSQMDFHPMDTGWHSYTWNPRTIHGELGSGVYLVRVRAGAYSKTIKLLFLK